MAEDEEDDTAAAAAAAAAAEDVDAEAEACEEVDMLIPKLASAPIPNGYFCTMALKASLSARS
jgi:hypothetical protein